MRFHRNQIPTIEGTTDTIAKDNTEARVKTKTT